MGKVSVEAQGLNYFKGKEQVLEEDTHVWYQVTPFGQGGIIVGQGWWNGLMGKSNCNGEQEGSCSMEGNTASNTRAGSMWRSKGVDWISRDQASYDFCSEDVFHTEGKVCCWQPHN